MKEHAFESAGRLPEVDALVLHINSGAARREVAQTPRAPGPSGLDEEVDADLLAKAVRLHADMVPRYAFRLTGMVHDAEDLAQDVFVRVLRSLPRFDPDLGSMEGWLYRITLNLFRDKLRKDRLREPGRFDGDADPLCTRPGPAEVALAGHLDPDLESALQSLTPAMLDTVLLADVVGLSHREIAATTGVARGTVASRLCRAHARLQAQLAPRRASGTTNFAAWRSRLLHRGQDRARAGARADAPHHHHTDEESQDVSVHSRLRWPPSRHGEQASSRPVRHGEQLAGPGRRSDASRRPGRLVDDR